MENFSVGIYSIALAVLFSVLYFVAFQLRRVEAWSKRAEGPKDRVGFFIAVFATFGFLIGGFVQPVLDKNDTCRESGRSFTSCLLKLQ